MKSILIFDSGVGGLSVYEEIAAILPEQHIIYAFDNAAFPYGELNDDILIQRVCGMLKAISEKHEISLIVIACNTASTLVLPPLRKLFDIPVVGVVPAIKPAALASTTKHIALLATPATVKRDYTHQLINDFASECEVTLLGSSDLVYMAEDKLRNKPVQLEKVAAILGEIPHQVDQVVLGCTHFPLLKTEIKACLPKRCTVIDSGKAIALRVNALLDQDARNQDGNDIKVANTQQNSKEVCKKGACKKNVPHYVYSSAPVNSEEALNQYFMALGFNPIHRTPTF